MLQCLNGENRHEKTSSQPTRSQFTDTQNSSKRESSRIIEAIPIPVIVYYIRKEIQFEHVNVQNTLSNVQMSEARFRKLYTYQWWLRCDCVDADWPLNQLLINCCSGIHIHIYITSVSSWWPSFPSRNSVLIYIYLYVRILYTSSGYRTYMNIHRECRSVLVKLHPITVYRELFWGVRVSVLNATCCFLWFPHLCLALW